MPDTVPPGLPPGAPQSPPTSPQGPLPPTLTSIPGNLPQGQIPSQGQIPLQGQAGIFTQVQGQIPVQSGKFPPQGHAQKSGGPSMTPGTTEGPPLGPAGRQMPQRGTEEWARFESDDEKHGRWHTVLVKD